MPYKHPDPDPALAQRLRSTIELLESIANNRALLWGVPTQDRERFHRAIADVYNPDPVARRLVVKAAEREQTAIKIERMEAVLQDTGIRTLRRKPVFTSPDVFPPPDFDPHEAKAVDPQHCYICKQKFTVVHHFYDQMCPPCAEFNFSKRTELADLSGRVALLTGGRVKIGYQAGLKLLRAGARLIVTTRFPSRFGARAMPQEPDFAEWGDRLEIFGLDMRHTPSVEALLPAAAGTRCPAWISSSTMRARPCADRPIFTRT